MKKIKIFLSTLLVGMCFVLNGQVQQDTMVNVLIRINSAKLYDDLMSIGVKQSPFQSKTKVISKVDINEMNHVITITCQNNKKILDNIHDIVCGNAVIFEEYDEDILLPKPVEKPSKYASEIDVFLNIEDSTIFLDENFLKLDKNQIHPRSYEYYYLIENIHTLKKQLDTINGLGFGERARAEKLLDNAKETIDIIKSLIENNANILSLNQESYYERMRKIFNKIWDDVYQ